MKKLKAFTLMELLIGMIISTIVIGFCYTSYTLIYKQFLNYKTAKQEVVETMQFYSVFKNDISKSDRVLFNENRLTLVKKQFENLEFDFSDAFILRKTGEVVDTFRIKSLNLLSIGVTGDNSFSKLVFSFSFDSEFLGEQEHFQFSKKYDAETVINTEIENIQKN